MNRGDYHYAVDQNLVCTTWKDNKVVNILSNCCVVTGNVVLCQGKCCVMLYLRQSKFRALQLFPCITITWAVWTSLINSKSHTVQIVSQKGGTLDHHLFDICVANSYVLYRWKCKDNHLSVMTQLEFRSKLVIELIGNFSCRKRPGSNPRYRLLL